METFCTGGYGIVSGYRRGTAGKAEPAFLSPRCDVSVGPLPVLVHAVPDIGRGLPGDDARPLVHQVLDAFWCHTTRAEALARGTYTDDSGPAGAASRPFTA